MEALHFRLRALRRKEGLSLEQLASRTGLTKSYLSKLERGLSEPSVSTLLKLSEAFNLGVSQLLGEVGSTDDESVCIVRANEREPIVRHGTELGYRYESLASKRLVKAMNPFMLYPPKSDGSSPSAFPHSGEEFLFVIKGTVRLNIAGKSYYLDAGDSVYFDSELPHRVYSNSDEQAKILLVASPGSRQ